MARELVALKVRIGLRANGQADHPDFNLLPVVAASGMDWAFYVDREGEGWRYDNLAGHAEEVPDSPRGMRWGMLLVPEQFAVEAVAQFPSLCSRLTEAEAADFYDNRHALRLASELRDTELLTAVETEIRLLDQQIAETPDGSEKDRLVTRRSDAAQRRNKAIDPDDPEPGVKRNPRKRWTDFKADAGVIFKERA